MSFMDCIDRALAKEKITGKRRDEARERYQNLYNNAIADGVDPIAAEQQAADQATQQVAADIALRKASTYKQMAWSIDDWRQWQKADGKNLGWNAGAVIEGTIGATPGRISLNDNTTYATGQIRRYVQDMMNKYSPKLVGLVYPKGGLENIVRELFAPGSTGDEAAAAMAKSWVKATDYGVMLYQRTGALLNHLEEWRLPQYQSRIKVFKAKVDPWVKDHMGWVDWNKMTFPDGSRIDVADRERVLREAYNSIVTDGDIRIKPGQMTGHGGGGLTEHRFLIYKDADSWLAAHEKYADGSIYDTMKGHIDGMGRRIGIAQSFGPKPEMGLEQMIANMKRTAGEAEAQVAAGARSQPKQWGLFPTTYTDEAKSAENFLRDAFQVKVKGMNAPLSGLSAAAAGTLGTTRSLIMSSVGGSVILYQGTQDFFTAALRYRMAGLPVMHAMKTYYKTFLGLNKEMVDLFSRSGFINLAQTNVAQSAARLTGLEPEGMQWARHLSDVVMRASLTEWHAASARLTTAMEFAGALADWKDMPFDKVPGKRVFEAHGINEADWDALRSTPINTSLKGHAFLMPDDHIVHAGQTDASFEVANKFMAMINQEAKLATIETQVAAQLTLKGATRPGTLIGEVTRSLAMFKNFPLTLFNTHIRQAILDGNTIPGKIGYASAVILGMTLFGAVGVMLHDIANGKNPEAAFDHKNLVDPLFWTRGLLASGGGGIVSDLIAGNLEHGKTFGESLAGAPISMLSDLNNLVGTAASAAAGNPKAHFAREANKFGARWMPGDTIWYMRAPIRAMIWDNLLKATDPDAASVFRRRADWTQQQTGQSYWWGPGQSAPNSAPDLTALVRK